MNLPFRPTFWMSAAYFAFYAGIACWGPYIVLYYQLLGLSGAQIGVLNAITPLGMAFLAPLWGSLADAWNAHRLILRAALLTTAGIALLLAAASSFWQVVLLIAVFALIGTTASPLLDSYGVTLGAQQGGSFGQMRVWGSIGYTVVVWLIGIAMGGTVSRLFLFGYALALVGTCLTTQGLPVRRGSRSLNRWQGAGDLLRRRDMQVVLLSIFLLFIATNPVFALFGIYIKDLGGTTQLLGATSAIAAVSEFPVFFWASWLTKRVGSRPLFIIALSFFIVRILLYAVVPSATWVLGVQLLHGFSFGFYLVAVMALIHELAGAEHAATAQGLLASAMAFGQMVGALVGGVLLDQIGIVAIYRISAGIMVLALAVFVVGQRWYSSNEAPLAHAPPERHGES